MQPQHEDLRHVLRRNFFGGAVAWCILTFSQVILVATNQPEEAVFLLALEACFMPWLGWMTYLQARRAWLKEPPSDMDIRTPATFCVLAFPVVIGTLKVFGSI